MSLGLRAVVVLALVAIAVAIAGAWLAPVALLDPRIARATGGVLRLADADGTLRQGRGNLVAGATRIPVAWRVDFWPLLGGVIRVRLVSGTGAGTPRATIVLATESIALQDVDVTLPAGVIAATLGYGTAGSVAGAITLKADDIEWAPGSSRGEAHLAWRSARITFADSAVPFDLGDVRAGVMADGSVLSGPLENEGGDVVLRGEWTVRARDGVRLGVHLTPRRPGLPDLERTLSAIGTPEGNGWRIEWRGALP